MGTIDPEEMLRGALEKIVFFECRVSQLESELAAARQVAERARLDAAAARRREVELERANADERGARTEAETHAQELAERVRLLETERERLLSGLVERARVGGAPASDGEVAEEGGADLAGFIAELRAEIEDLRAFKASVEQARHGEAAADAKAKVPPAPPRALPRGGPPARGEGPEPVLRLAERFEAEGRMGLSARDGDELKALLPTRSDRVLYERAMDELGAAEPARRARAARTLETLGSKAAAPLLAAALGREPEAEVKVALLGALAKLEEPFAVDLARRALGDGRPVVRVAALEAMAARAGDGAVGDLIAALRDASPLVRRRAALLLGFAPGAAPEEALAGALSDADAGVARAAAAALSGRPSAAAQNALARALEHADEGVRRAAAGALGHWTGEVLDVAAPAHERRRMARRIAEKLAALSEGEVRAAVLAAAAGGSGASHGLASPPVLRKAQDERLPAVTAVRPVQPAPRVAAPARAAAALAGPAPAALARATPSVVAAPAPAAVAASAAPAGLERQILGELRAALRGCTPAELVSVLEVAPAAVEAALHTLAARGAATLRGSRWFMS